MFVLFSQEELSARICGLLKAFSDGAAALRFAAAFFATQANEWNRLDQWRMDKYMMVTMSMATRSSIGNTRIQGYLFSSDLKMYTGLCLGDIPFIHYVKTKR